MDLNHLHLHVADPDRSRRFYEEHLGFREKVRHGDILFLTNDHGFDLALGPGEPFRFPSWFHFGFRVASRDAVEALHARMAASGAAILAPYASDEDMAWFRCADPDGHAIEVYWE